MPDGSGRCDSRGRGRHSGAHHRWRSFDSHHGRDLLPARQAGDGPVGQWHRIHWQGDVDLGPSQRCDAAVDRTWEAEPERIHRIVQWAIPRRVPE